MTFSEPFATAQNSRARSLGTRRLPLTRTPDPVWPAVLRVIIATVAFVVVVAAGLAVAFVVVVAAGLAVAS